MSITPHYRSIEELSQTRSSAIDEYRRELKANALGLMTRDARVARSAKLDVFR